MAINSFNFGGQDSDPEIVRENFNKIARYLSDADLCVLSLQSESANISALGANVPIRNFTVFMRSDTGDCDVTIPNPVTFALSVIEKKDTIFFFKGLSGAGTKTVNINSGTVEGETSLTLSNDQTVCIQSDGTEYKILFDTAAFTSGSGDTGDFVESVTGYNVDNTDPVNPVILPVEVDEETITGTGVSGDPLVGVTPGIDKVLAVSEALTALRTIDLNGQELDITDVGGTTFVLDGSSNSQFYFFSSNGNSIQASTLSNDVKFQHSNGGLIIASADGIELSNNADLSKPIYLGLTHSGTLLNKVLINAPDFANDAAAATGGVPVNGIYRTGSNLKMRVS